VGFRKLFGAAAVAAPLLFCAAACSAPAPTHGYVRAENYTAPSSWYTPGYYEPIYCGKGCYTQMYMPGHWNYEPANWQIELCQKPGAPSKTNTCGWRDVDEQTYHSVKLGQFWTTVAGNQ
jgi:hypothetical protein